jgi:hypothetical protein
MFDDKILKSVAEAVKQVLATEKLHPNQQKLDVHEPEKDKLTSKDFEMLRKGKKADVKEANNPFDYKNYKSQIPTKPGEKAGFDSKKISTGTVYTRKPVKDEKPVKEGASQEDYLKEIEMAKKRAQGQGNPDLTKGKVTAVKQESVEQMDEGSGPKEKQKTPYRDINSPEYRAAAEKQKQKMKDTTAAEPGKKMLSKMNKEEVEQIDETHQVVAKTKQGETFKSAIYPTKEKALAQHYKMSKSGNFKNVETVKVKEEVEHIEERSLSTAEKTAMEKNVKGMKKSVEGFKARYGKDAKSVMYATATKMAKKD